MNKDMIMGKNIFARILSNENVRVVHSAKATTASMDVVRRVLTLPQWKDMSSDLYTMFIAHEVGHARFTPGGSHGHKRMLKFIQKEGIPFAYLNICEDVRIEKKMKREFPGLPKIFSQAYSEAMEDHGFFDINKYDDVKTYDDLCLADRINVYSKVGHLIEVNFKNDEELRILRMIEDAVTFDDTLAATKALFEYEKKNAKTDQLHRSKKDDEGEEDENGSGVPMPQTDEETDELMESLQDDEEREECKYITIGHVTDISPVLTDSNELLRQTAEMNMGRVMSLYDELIMKNRPVVNHMVTRFRMSQAAKLYEKKKVAKTGIVDPVKMMNYKTSDDIFRRSTALPKGKRHALAIVLDWSGSMEGACVDAVEHVITLVEFCRQLSIPFEVFSFTTNGFWETSAIDQEHIKEYIARNNVVEDDFTIDPSMIMTQIGSSRMNRRDQDRVLAAVYESAKYHRNGERGECLQPLRSMCGTPLTSAIYSASTAVESYKSSHRIDISHIITVSDGMGNSGGHQVKGGRFTAVNTNRNTVLHDRITGREYYIGRHDVDCDFESGIIDVIRDRYNAKVIGFFIGELCSEILPYFNMGEDEVKSLNERGMVETNFKTYSKYYLSRPLKSLSEGEEVDAMQQLQYETHKRNILCKFIDQLAT